jgi:aminoglycoside phosphotransferase family enzyme
VLKKKNREIHDSCQRKTELNTELDLTKSAYKEIKEVFRQEQDKWLYERREIEEMVVEMKAQMSYQADALSSKSKQIIKL